MWATQTSSQESDYVVCAVAGEAAQCKHTFSFELLKASSVECYVGRTKRDKTSQVIRSVFTFVRLHVHFVPPA